MWKKNVVCNIWCYANYITAADENIGQIKLYFDTNAERIAVSVCVSVCVEVLWYEEWMEV